MYRPYSTIKGYTKYNPLLLLNITDPKMISFANSLLPFSTGIEIEATFKSSIGLDNDDCSASWEKLIPELCDVDIDESETRLRIPPGINGFVALWKISNVLKKHYYFNNRSGIHYHIDCTDLITEKKNYYYNFSQDYDGVSPVHDNTASFFNNRILKPLVSWNYKNSYNTRGISFSANWIRINKEFKTLEYRIGEMTFDYDLLLKRILHCQHLTILFKRFVTNPKHNSIYGFRADDFSLTKFKINTFEPDYDNSVSSRDYKSIKAKLTRVKETEILR